MKITLFAASALALFAICANVSGQSQAPAPPPAKKQKQLPPRNLPRIRHRPRNLRQIRIRRRESVGSVENCGRCHNPPESISPIEVNAVLRHMRVRAMLSAEDEELIRKYLAP